jgi:hypothetical protein
VRLYAIGDEGDDDVLRRRPGVVPLLWTDILDFIHDRFTTYRREKADHHQRGTVGQRLFQLAKTESPTSTASSGKLEGASETITAEGSIISKFGRRSH